MYITKLVYFIYCTHRKLIVATWVEQQFHVRAVNTWTIKAQGKSEIVICGIEQVSFQIKGVTDVQYHITAI